MSYTMTRGWVRSTEWMVSLAEIFSINYQEIRKTKNYFRGTIPDGRMAMVVEIHCWGDEYELHTDKEQSEMS